MSTVSSVGRLTGSLLLAAFAAEAAVAKPAAGCATARTFGTFALQCSEEAPRQLCTMESNGDLSKGLRIATRSRGPGETGELTGVQAIIMFASPQLTFQPNQRPEVVIRRARANPEHATGIVMGPHSVAVKSGVEDITLWTVGEPSPLSWQVSINGQVLNYSFAKPDFMRAFNAMTGCQLAYLKAHDR